MRRPPEVACVSGYVLSVDADFDLDDIWEYIASDHIDAADRWIERLFDAFEVLGQTPGMGHRREDLNLYPVLFWQLGAYLITSSFTAQSTCPSRLWRLRRFPVTFLRS
jgi:plasmid stabilization system protein ParE